jgi:hypothetical protein
MRNTQDNISGSNCYKIASTVDEFKMSSLKDIIIKKAKEAY